MDAVPTIDLDRITGTRLVTGVDSRGRLTSDPTEAVMGTLELSLTDGTVMSVTFDRPDAIPVGSVAT